MAKFNEVQKKRRALIVQRKRISQGDPITRKLKNKQRPIPVSGKRKRKLLKQWRRDQKLAVEKGLITMEDIEMAASEVSLQEKKKRSREINVKKVLKLKKGKKKLNSKQGKEEQVAVDAMIE